MYKKELLALGLSLILSMIGGLSVHGQVFNPNVCFVNGVSILNGDTITLYEQFQVPFGTNCSSVEETFTCTQGVLVANNPANQASDYTYTSCSTSGPVHCSLGSQYGQQTVVQHGEYATGYRDDFVEPGQLCDTIGPSGNVGQLQCNNGTFTAASWWIVNVNDYTYPTCEVREHDDCVFNGEIIEHGFSVSGFLAPHPAIGGQCVEELRTCYDGTLGGSYQFSDCTETSAVCGNATEVEHSITPAQNLCEEGYLLGSVGVNPSNGKWSWSCGGYGLTVERCEADPTPLLTGVAQCGVFTGYYNYLTGGMSSLCLPQSIYATGLNAFATGFTQTTNGWTWSCQYNNTSATNCSALNDVKPSATITYSPDEDTDGSVTATLTNIQPAGATIFNNNGSSIYTFDSNGSFNFILEFDGKFEFVKAEVDWISERTDIFKKILNDYEDELCDDFNVNLQDAYDSIYHTAVLTMQNNCIMKGYNFRSKNMFLINKPISVIEAIVTLKKSMEKLGDYKYIVNEPTGMRYFGINSSDTYYSFIKRAEDIDLLQYLNQTQNGNIVYIDWDRPIKQDELKTMFNHTLYVHFFHEELSDRYYNEVDFADDETVTRGEHARMLERVLGSYPHIPVGNDYRLLSLIYDMIKDESINDQKQKLIRVNKVLSRMPLQMLTEYGLSKWRLITDIQAIINNRLPKRNDKKDITIDMVRYRLRLTGQPEYTVSIENMDEFIYDDYDDFDPLGW